MAGALAGRRGRRRRLSVFGRIVYGTLATLFLAVLFAAGTVAGVVYSYSRNLPDINRMADFQPSRSTRIYARDGTLLATLFKQNRIFVPISHVPERVRDAFVANEDHNFYKHHGVDFSGIARAALADYKHERLQGASTITQQLARALFLSNEVSISRKIQEALLAMEIERYYTKDEILERYLNLIYFGAGAYGIEAAAHNYFGTDVGHLTLAQAAMLAGLPAAPSDYSPYVDRGHAIERQRHVLERMVASGYVTQAQASAAEGAPLGLIGERPTGLQSFRYPYFTTYVNHVLDTTFGARPCSRTARGRYDARSDAAEEGRGSGELGRGARGRRGHQRTPDGARRDSPANGRDRCDGRRRGRLLAQEPIQSGVAGAAPTGLFVQGVRLYRGGRQRHAADEHRRRFARVLSDGRRHALAADGRRFPFPRRRHAALRARAIAQRRGRQTRSTSRRGSRHRVRASHGRSRAARSQSVPRAREFGRLTARSGRGYATLANQGIHIDPSPLRLVKDSFGSPLLDNRFPQETEVVSAGTAYLMTSMLEGVIKEGTGYPNAVLDRPAAGKTGTTSDFRDAWFVGFTPDLVTAVWLGNDDYSRMNESYGGNVPARTWARFMRAALAHVPKHDFAYPSTEVRKIAYCGEPKKFEYFLDGTEPRGCASATYYRPSTAMDGMPPVAAEPAVAAAPRAPAPHTPKAVAERIALPSPGPERAADPSPSDPPSATQPPMPATVDVPAPASQTSAQPAGSAGVGPPER